jgi:Flp pilus assembly protein TadB
MRSRKPRRDQPYLVTDAQRPRSAEIRLRERRYLLIMGVRLVCFVVAGVLFVNHAGWLALVPAAGAILLPYIAVVVANSRQPDSTAAFRGYEARLPERYIPPGSEFPAGPPGPQADDGGK